VTLTVGEEVSTMTSQIQGLVDAMNASTTAITTATHSNASGSGTLAGDTWLRTVPQGLARAFVNNSGVSANALGLSIDKYGVMSFDAATFRTQVASTPTTAKATITELARQVGAITKVATQPVSGMITKALAEKQDRIDSLTKKISDWDDKLAARTTLLTQLYSTLNANLASMKTTSDWISSQITSLTAKTN
jgi:flagellar hook-associated protein 2